MMRGVTGHRWFPIGWRVVTTARLLLSALTLGGVWLGLKPCVALAEPAGSLVGAARAAAGAETGRLAPPAWTSGVRAGFSASSFDDPFVQGEAWVSRTFPRHLPWFYEADSGWYVQTRLELTSGWLHGQHKEGWVGTLGPGLEIGRRDFPLKLEIGSSPTGLSRARFRSTDFGVKFQFTSHAGLTYEVGRHLSLGYRLQHMSNAHLSSHNPGLDLHLFAVGWRF